MKKAYTLLELLVTLVILCIAGGILFGGCSKYLSTSDGTRVGTVTKFSKKGIMFKSYEGEMLQGGAQTAGGTYSANVWEFSVEDPQVAKQVEEALLSQSKIALKYEQSKFEFDQDTQYTVVSVTKLDTGQK